jgi:hypothetical protein
MKASVFVLAVLGLASIAQAQQTIVSPNRSIDWSRAGAAGGVQNRTVICSTLSPGATVAQINSAIQSCPAGQVVKLNAGTFNLAGGIDFAGKDNVTLRGAGPDKTFLVFSNDTGCFGLGADICVRGNDGWWTGGLHFSASWTGGYGKGSTSLTFSNTTGLTVGTLVLLDQINDSNTDTGTVWVCTADNICSDEGGGSQGAGSGTTKRAQQQIVQVTGISGNTVNITPGIYMPNWRSSQSPNAMWGSDVIVGAGVEDLSLDNTVAASNGFEFFGAMDSWVKNVKSYKSNRAHVLLYQSSHITIRDSYFDENLNHGSQCYGVEFFISSDILVENNIFHHVTLPIATNGTASGSVVSYNYLTGNTYTVSPTWMIAGYGLHEGGIDNMLFEGNDGPGFIADGVHGTHHFVTAFRNYFSGLEPGKSAQTNPVKIYAFGRYFNFVGNVLGTDTYHTNYANGDDGSIYDLGQSPGIGVPSDPLVATTLFRWGNYDTVNDAPRFIGSEVPSGLGLYSQAVPTVQTLPNSFYLSSKPAFFGSSPWPAIGPDVTGGTIAGLNGRAYKNPARKCYETTAKDVNGFMTAYNAQTCYASVAVPPPTAPMNVRIIR